MERFERILVVDDDDLLRRNVKRILHGAGFTELWDAADGSEAVALALACQPDFVILDEEMPYLSGAACAPLIREQAPNATIVAFSGKVNRTPAWADAYLSKEASSLLETFIDVVIADRKQQEQTG